VLFRSVGNITQIRDDAQQTHYFNNAVVKPEFFFEYDAIYQLLRAGGREHAGSANDEIRNNSDLDFVPQLPHPNDAAAVRNYTEEYEYDLLGNIKTLRHRFKTQTGAGNGWTRHYRYAYEDDTTDRTNRLISTSLPGDPDAGPYSATYRYDDYGNMTNMLPHLSDLKWNFMDQLRQVDLGGGGTAYYVYGAGGQRIRKVIERQGGKRTERIYLGAVEIYRERQGNDAPHLERQTLHISDNAGRIAQVDTKTIDDNDSDPANALNTPLIRYQYSNHLGSAMLETDDGGEVISYEEYHPYGTSAYRSAKPGFDLSLKRYRFSGKERDDETGLYYFGARYYAAWLGRWTSSDPAGFVSGSNLFRYCANNPIMLHDPNGMDEKRTYHVDDSYLNNVSDPKEFSKRLRERGWDFTGFDDEGNPVEPDAQGRGVGSAKSKGENRWDLGRLLKVPGEGGGNSQTSPPSEPTPSASSSDTSGSGNGTSLPLRPALDTSTPVSPQATEPIPKLDITQAPPGTDFERAESAARSASRSEHGMTGRQTQAHHSQPWREGQRTNTHPRITNHPRLLIPVSTQRGTGGSLDGRQYSNQHLLAEARYRREAVNTARSYGSFATERVTSLLAAQRARQATSSNGSRGPLFLREYIVAPLVQGFIGHTALAATRTLVPFVVEAELVLMGVGMFFSSFGFAKLGLAVSSAASYVPVAGAGVVTGAIVGNVAEGLATSLGASEGVAKGTGAVAAALSGAAVGALIGSVIPIVGTAAGAAVGAVFGLIGYRLF